MQRIGRSVTTELSNWLGMAVSVLESQLGLDFIYLCPKPISNHEGELQDTPAFLSVLFLTIPTTQW